MPDLPYIVVRKQSLPELESAVSAKVVEGYMPIGGIFIFPATSRVAQPGALPTLGGAQAMIYTGDPLAPKQ